MKINNLYQKIVIASLVVLITGSPFLNLASPVYAIPNHFLRTIVANNFTEPVDFAFTSDGRIFVAEKAGVIKIVKDGVLQANPLGTVPTDSQGERGLLGIAVDPQFTSNHFIYLYFMQPSPLEMHISRFTVSGDSLNLASELVLLKSTQTLGFVHHAGGLQFSPDGKIWATVGDNEGTNPNNAQDLSNIHGKILRINPDGSIPSDNPFVGQAGKQEAIWAYGLRNAFRFSFLPDGRPIIGDVGGDFWEEVDVGVKGGNFGWPTVEGTCNNCPFMNPVYTYAHNGSSSSITGGFVYTGSQFPSEYTNRYFFSDYVRGFLKYIQLDNQGSLVGSEQLFDDQAGAVVSLKQGPDGSLYYVTIFPGTLSKVSYTTANLQPTAKIAATPVSGAIPLTVSFSSNGSIDPENAPLIYKWNFGDSTTSSEQNPTHTYQTKGTYMATLIVNDGSLDSQQVSITIFAGNLAPTATIVEPLEGTPYNAGQTFTFKGDAQDQEDGALPDSAFSWNIIFHHGTHTHPFLGPITNTKSGTFMIPDTGEASADTYYEVQLTVTDSQGQQTVVKRNIIPNKIDLTLVTDPQQGVLTLQLDGIPYALPYTVSSVVGFKHLLTAPDSQVAGGSNYKFVSWSDGGNAEHTATTPSTATTYKATYHTDDPIPFTVEANKPTQVTQYAVVVGDIKANDQALYDNDGNTGLVTLFTQPTTIVAPWGARGVQAIDRATAEQKMQEVADRLKIVGCAHGCTSVTTLHWPDDFKPQTYQLKPGEKQLVSQYSVIAGDVKIDGVAIYDGDPKTGTALLLDRVATVDAPWGATIYRNADRASGEAKLASVVAHMKANGCNGTCVSVSNFVYSQLHIGEQRTVTQDSLVSGDVKVNNTAMYDSNAGTGLVVQLQQQAQVIAQWGASTFEHILETDIPALASRIAGFVKSIGCGASCQQVDILPWPGTPQQ